MNYKSLCIGFNNPCFINGDVLEPIETISDSFAPILGTTLSELKEDVKDFTGSFSFTLKNPKLRVLRFLGVISGSKRNPLNSREIMRFIKHNQL